MLIRPFFIRPFFIRPSLLLPVLTLALLSGCDLLGLPDHAKEAALKEADARATGSACRHAGRGIEDCYAQNPDSARAPVYAGWKEMNDYMRENNIAEVKSSVAPAAAEEASSTAEHASASASANGKSKPGKKSAEH